MRNILTTALAVMVAAGVSYGVAAQQKPAAGAGAPTTITVYKTPT